MHQPIRGDWDYKAFRAVADEVGATILADIAHPAGLIAAKQLNDPIPHCHIICNLNDPQDAERTSRRHCDDWSGL
ncbi:MAG: hypothetical protein U0T81_11230 [Saprospiraceae bacterium]